MKSEKESTTPGERLRWFREEYRRVSARAYAQAVTAAGYPATHNQVLRYERGAKIPGAYLLAIHAGFGANPQWVLTGKGPHLSTEVREGVYTGVAATGQVMRWMGEVFLIIAERSRNQETEDWSDSYEIGPLKIEATIRGLGGSLPPTHKATHKKGE